MVSWAKVLSADTLDRNPTVIFLPGHLFFAKSLELPKGMGRDELDSYIEISLEEHAPFPVNQLYSGAYHVEGSGRVLIYAAYRKRFTSGEKELWEEADLVLPDFISLFGMAPKEPSLHLLVQEGTVTGIYFDGKDSVPAEVYSRHLDPEVSVDERKEAVSRLVARFVSAYGELPVNYYRRKGEVSKHKGRVYFAVTETGEDGEPPAAAGNRKPALDLADVPRLDLRDREVLAEKRKAAVLNVWLWRSTVSLAGLLVLLLIGEAVLYGVERTLANREEMIESRAEQVGMIQEQLELAERMEELGESQLLPFEMLAILNDYRMPSLTFRRTVTNEWNGLMVEAVTGNSRDVNEYENALRQSGKFDHVEVRDQQVRGDERGGETTFTLHAIFKEEALRQRAEVAGFRDRRNAGLEVAAEDTNGEDRQ